MDKPHNRIAEFIEEKINAQNKEEDMTDTDVHSCGYYCDRPLCIKAQRDELRDKLFAKEFVGLTDDELIQIGVATGLERAAVMMITNKLKEKNNG